MASICRLLSSPSALRLHNFGRFRPFSMSSVKDHVTRVESTVEEAVPWECDRNRVEVRRGFWYAQLDTLVGPEMCRILAAKVSEKRDHHLKCYEEILDSKGINARQIVDLFTKQVKANVSAR